MIEITSAYVPGMYIPNKDYCVYELVDNGVDILINNENSHLYETKLITLNIDTEGIVTVTDSAGALPIREAEDAPGCTVAELCVSRLKAGTKFEEGVKSAGLNGVGSSAINFLSEYFYVRISKLGKLYGLDFEQGLVVNQLYEMEDEDNEYPDNGTLIMLRPDDEIWQDIGNTLDIPAINKRLKQLAYLNPGLTINF